MLTSEENVGKKCVATVMADVETQIERDTTRFNLSHLLFLLTFPLVMGLEHCEDEGRYGKWDWGKS